MSYDAKCWELAEHFLQDHKGAEERDKAELAQLIQDIVEDWIADFETK